MDKKLCFPIPKQRDASGTVINPSTSDKQESLLLKLVIAIQALLNPAWYDRSLNRLRQTGIIESGTLTTVTTVATVTTVTTVATVTAVTGLTNIDGYQGKLLAINQNMSAWVLACRNRIT